MTIEDFNKAEELRREIRNLTAFKQTIDSFIVDEYEEEEELIEKRNDLSNVLLDMIHDREIKFDDL